MFLFSVISIVFVVFLYTIRKNTVVNIVSCYCCYYQQFSYNTAVIIISVSIATNIVVVMVIITNCHGRYQYEYLVKC